MDLASWATLTVAATSVGSLAVVAYQLRSLARQAQETARQAECSAEATRAAVYLAVAKTMVEIDMFFIEQPELRAYLYGPISDSSGSYENQRKEATAEMFVDFIDCVIAHEKHIPGDFAGGWLRYFEDIMHRSVPVQDFWRQNRTWYTPEVQQILDPALAAADAARIEADKSSRP